VNVINVPRCKHLGTKWTIVYWDYSSGSPRKRSKVWATSTVPSRREAQRLAGRSLIFGMTGPNTSDGNTPGIGKAETVTVRN
jgi:hypothetical protein